MVDRTAPLRPARPETACSTSPVRAHKNKPSQTEETTASGNEHFRGSAAVTGASAARVVSAAQQAHTKRCTNPGQNVNRFAELPRRTRPPPIAQRQPCRRRQHGGRGCGCESHSIAQHMYVISAHVCHLRAQLGQSSRSPGCVPGHQRTSRKPPQMTWKKRSPPTSTYPSPRRGLDLHRRCRGLRMRSAGFRPAYPQNHPRLALRCSLGDPSPAPQHARGSKELCTSRPSEDAPTI
jgi:hypothetical protein